MPRYAGFYLEVTRRSRTQKLRHLYEGNVLLCVGEPDESGWVPIVFRGIRDAVKVGNVRRID